MMNDTTYQAIYNEIEPLLPNKWERLVIYIEYGKASYSMFFYVGKQDKMVKCYDLPDVTDNELLTMFARIDKLLSTEREKEEDKWSNMTMVVNGNDFKVFFDYTDLSIGSYKYKKEWKKKYIG